MTVDDTGDPAGQAPGSPRPELADRLELQPHPEGGWYRETWRSQVVSTPEGYDGTRCAATAIYYLLQPGEQSRWHLVRSDELWLWHFGGPLTLRLGGTGDQPSSDVEVVTLDGRIAGGFHPQVLVPGGVWQSAEPGEDLPVLVTCVVAPGFEYTDFRLAPQTPTHP